MAYLTSDDFRETYSKLKQRGLKFLLSKINVSGERRTLSAFNESNIEGSNWWMIPAVQERWNKKITGSSAESYESYISEKYLLPKEKGSLLSVGCGSCSHELEIAKLCSNWEITCIDIAQNLLEEAKNAAKKEQLFNIKFIRKNVLKEEFTPDSFDVILFHSSLHHFQKVYSFLKNKICPQLKQNGLLIIHEYVGPNRLQFPKKQINVINKALQTIPPEFRKRFIINHQKNKITGPGLWRMIIADPSECVDSAAIKKAIHNMFITEEEAELGGNILMLLLKDIAHHFVNEKANIVLEHLFTIEEEYLKENNSDFIFGVYRKK